MPPPKFVKLESVADDGMEAKQTVAYPDLEASCSHSDDKSPQGTIKDPTFNKVRQLYVHHLQPTYLSQMPSLEEYSSSNNSSNETESDVSAEKEDLLRHLLPSK